jgi:hypothetical protein
MIQSIRLTPEMMIALGDLARSGRLVGPADTDALSKGYLVTFDPEATENEVALVVADVEQNFQFRPDGIEWTPRNAGLV